MQKAPQTPHRIRDSTRPVTKVSLASLEGLRCQRSETTTSAIAEIFFNCSASENVTLTSEESVSLPDQPLVEIIQNATQQRQATMFVVGLWKEFSKHRRLLDLGDPMLPLM
jgi:hypothetical protein